MSKISIKNELKQELNVYDSFESQDKSKNYYGTLKELSELKPLSTTSVKPLHGAVNTFILFDQKQKPLARFVSMFGKNSFKVTKDNVSAMAEATKFVEYIGSNPDSKEATGIKKLKSAKDINAFFKASKKYSQVTVDTYMMALTYKAAHPDKINDPPEKRTYSLATLVSYLSGKPYPKGMPDITISQFFFHNENDILEFGGQVSLKDLPFKNDAIGKVIYGLLPNDKKLNVRIQFDLEVGLNIGGTKIECYYDELDIPLGGKNNLKLKNPTISLSINPLFKFVIFEVSAEYPFTLFGKKFDTKCSLVIDNIEIEAGFAIEGDHNALPSPPLLKGVHFDEFGVGMGIIFEPPGYNLGVSGKFHIGSGANVVSVDDNTFALILDLEGDVPNPVYISFYIPKLDFATFVSALTNTNVNIDFPISFLDLSFVWNENPLEPLALPDGTMSKGGYSLSGYMDLFGLKFYADIEIDLTKFTGVATMAPVNLGNILKITGDGKAITMKVDDKGNPIKNNQIPTTAAARNLIKNAKTKTLVPAGGPEMSISTTSSPYFTMNANASFLDILGESVDIVIDKKGFSFDLKSKVVIIKSDLSCNISSDGHASASFSFGPDLKIPLPSPLGSIHLTADIHANMALAVSSSSVNFSVGGGFDFEGISFDFGPFNLDVKTTSLSAVITSIGENIIENAGTIFIDLLKDVAKWAEWAFKGIISGVESIAKGLNSYFHQAINDASKVLKGIGMAVDQAATELKGAYNATADALASALNVGFSIEGAATAGILKGIGYSADEIGGALSSVFGLNSTAVANILKDTGIPIAQVTKVLTDVFKLSPNTISDVLKGVGYPVDIIADAFKAIGGPFTAIGQGLEDALNDVIHYANPSNW